MFAWFLVFLGWASVLIFVVVSAYRIVRWSRMPVNLRQEIYPVPNGSRERRRYGGSYMEETDWARKPQEGSSLSAELAEMGAEIFFFKRVREHNPYGLWPFSMAMHWGTYLLLAWAGLLVVGPALGAVGQAAALMILTNSVGVVAFVLGALGSLGLAVKRAGNAYLRLYTAPVDYVNLLFMAAIFVSGLLSWLADPALASHRAYVGGVLAFKPAAMPFLTGLCFLLFEIFLIYMPFSRLIHYFAKYFTIHRTLWEDRFKVKGSPLDQKIGEQLSYRVTWAGPHVAVGKTWLENIEVHTAPEDGRK
jgi:nitrate reductase gamma subunit